MALSRAQKEELVERYEGLASAPHAFLLGFQGITVPQVTALRARVRESGGQYVVVKNTLVKRAIEGRPLAEIENFFAGPTAVVYTEGDVVSVAKTLSDFAKEAPVLEFKAGIVDGQRVEGEQVKQIAQMPSREELIAKLLFLLQSPVTRLVRGLAALPRQLVVVLAQIQAKKSS